MPLEELFLRALVLTILFEGGLLLAIWKVGWLKTKPALKLWEVLLAGALPSALTIPYLWFVLPAFVSSGHYLVVGEGLVVLAEAPLLAWLLRVDLRKALLLSLACNAFSYAMGLALAGWL